MLDMFDQTNTQHRTSIGVLIDGFQHKTLGRSKRNIPVPRPIRRDARNHSQGSSSGIQCSADITFIT